MRLPILVGITGKRNLGPAESASVETRLRRVFGRLDDKFPHVPKVLLTGAAYGADAIAAGLVVRDGADGRPLFSHWSVVVLLPFEQELFEKDFRAPVGSDASATAIVTERLEALRRLLAPSPRVRVRVLPKLRADAMSAASVDAARLDKDAPGAEAALRHQHYEQVGQCIAELSTILIAVMDGGEIANRREADGGTARVVAYRRAGRPDELGRDVACRSAVLRNDWGPLVDPPANSVWLIEPRRSSLVDGYPVAVLPPIDEAAGEDVYAEPALPAEPSRRRSPLPSARQTRKARLLRESLVIAKGFERLHQIGDRLAHEATLRERLPSLPRWVPGRAAAAGMIVRLAAMRGRAAEPAPLDLARDARPLASLQQARSALSLVQGAAKTAGDRAFRAIAILFVLAVLSLEVFAEFRSDDAVLLSFYLGLLGSIFAIVFFARTRRWQPLSEDYRAVNEMLRIQRMWWSAGLSDRVDHLHLQASDPDISRLRDAVRTIVGWIWLRSDWPTAAPSKLEWTHVRGLDPRARSRSELSQGKAPADWIGGQIAYFVKNHDLHRRKVKGLAATTWPLFAASVWLAALLLLWLVSNPSGHASVHVSEKAHLMVRNVWGPAMAALLWSALAIGWFRLWGRLAERPERQAAHEPRTRVMASLSTVLVGLGGALLCGLAIQSAVGLIDKTHLVGNYSDTVKGVTVATFITLSAIAGATHYVSEKLNLVAQAQEYGDALGRFLRAERLLADSAGPDGLPVDLTAAQRIVRELAMLALRENEAWLKARRERPLSPVVG